MCTDEGGRDYLQHEYNRDGDSYRSPWDNKYCPPTESSFFPSPALRALEEKAFNIFTSYVKLYYGEATTKATATSAATMKSTTTTSTEL